jgi:hypothetical protein
VRRACCLALDSSGKRQQCRRLCHGPFYDEAVAAGGQGPLREAEA